MTTAFVSDGVWAEITDAVSNSKGKCFAAVAYFSKGASSQLPLTKGSSLVVNASDSMVAAGITSPEELKKLLNRGVLIFNEPKLHAKVFVVGKSAYIGSANVSQHSATHWIEAAVRTNEPKVVIAARRFVEKHCNDRMGPGRIDELQKIYRTQMLPGGNIGKRKTKKGSNGRTIPPLLLAQLSLVNYSEDGQKLCDEGESLAKQYRQHPRSWIQEYFQYIGKNPFKKNDFVIQVTNEGKGKIMIAGPARVLPTVPAKRIGGENISYVYLERPVQRRRTLKSLAKQLGCTQKQLERNGLVRNTALADGLWKIFKYAK